MKSLGQRAFETFNRERSRIEHAKGGRFHGRDPADRRWSELHDDDRAAWEHAARAVHSAKEEHVNTCPSRALVERPCEPQQAPRGATICRYCGRVMSGGALHKELDSEPLARGDDAEPLHRPLPEDLKK